MILSRRGDITCYRDLTGGVQMLSSSLGRSEGYEPAMYCWCVVCGVLDYMHIRARPGITACCYDHPRWSLEGDIFSRDFNRLAGLQASAWLVATEEEKGD